MIVPIKKPCKTTFVEHLIDADTANALFTVLRDEIPWEDGIKSKSGFTRKAHSCNMGNYPQVDSLITQALDKLAQTDAYAIFGIYLNYYRNGEDWTPSHNHPGTQQIVISLGATRTLNVAKKSYQMSSGSAIIFGSSQHGVPKEPTVLEGRISIATFMKAVQT